MKMLLRICVVFLLLLCLRQPATAQADTVITASGLKYVIKQEGKGRLAEKGNNVRVHYTGRLTDGRIFDSSEFDGSPIKITVGKQSVIKGWEEILLQMKKGTKLVVVIPPGLAYGTRGIPNAEMPGGYLIPPDATLIFEMELVKLKD